MRQPPGAIDLAALPRKRELARYIEAVDLFANPTTLATHDARAVDAVAFGAPLAALAQLCALRFNVATCVISLVSNEVQQVIAEATTTAAIEIAVKPDSSDDFYFGPCSFPASDGTCGYMLTRVAYASRNLRKAGQDARSEQGASYDGLDDDAIVVPDLLQDSFFSNHGVSKAPMNLRFYAGVPLVSPISKLPIGSFCMFDTKPRTDFGKQSVMFMKSISERIVRQLELFCSILEKMRAEKMSKSLGAFLEGETSIRHWWLRNVATLGRSSREQLEMYEPTSPVQFDRPQFEKPQLNGNNTNTPKKAKGRSPIPESENGPRNGHRDDLESGTSVFTRASNLMREAAELDGVLCIDARSPNLRTGLFTSKRGSLSQSQTADVPFGFAQVPASPPIGSNGTEKDRKMCSLMGLSVDRQSPSADQKDPVLDEDLLFALLWRYPHGKVFELDNDAPESPQRPMPRGRSNTMDHEMHSKLDSIDVQRSLSAALPAAKGVLFLPVSDSNGWSFAIIAYTSSDLRELTIDKDLHFLAIFSKCILAEMSKLDALKADMAKGAFIGSMSHELRSPLHGILGSAEMLKDIANEPQHDLVRSIVNCGQTLLDTIDHLLAFSKVSTQTTRPADPRQEPFLDQGDNNLEANLQLGILCEEVTESVVAGHSRAMLEATSRIGGKQYARLSADNRRGYRSSVYYSSGAFVRIFHMRIEPGALKRIITNLVSNSLKYTKKGSIEVSIHNTGLGASPQSHGNMGYITLTVKDTGIGMSEDYLQNNLYVPFTQENPHSHGTGLGLSIVRQIVISLGGKIDIESRQSVGTTIRVSIPWRESTGSLQSHYLEALGDIEKARRHVSGKTYAVLDLDDYLSDTTPTVASSDSSEEFKAVERSVSSLCGTFGLCLHGSKSGNADIYVASPRGSRRLLTSPNSSAVPVIVLCRTASEVKLHTNIAANIFPVLQPFGPLCLARLLSKISEAPLLHTPQQPNAAHNLPPSTPNLPQAESYALPVRLKEPISVETELPDENVMSQVQSVRRRALVVEDNVVNLKLMAKFCEKYAMDSVFAVNGQDAIDKFLLASDNGLLFDVILMDINMPVMDGMAATRSIRELESGLHKPSLIIGITGLSSKAAEAEALASGMDLFLSKPVRFARLQAILDAKLGPVK